MLFPRLIPCLLIHKGALYKTTSFENPKYVGDPLNAVRLYNDKEVDELMVLDITASKERREPNFSLIEQFAGECFMPLCYGGGIKTVEQAKTLFSLGVEKVCIQSSALDDLSIISRISEKYGSQSVLVSVDLKKNWLGNRKLYQSSSGKFSSLPWLDFLKDAVRAGAGEIVINSVERDGTMLGMDLALIKEASEALQVPLIAVGGVGSLSDIKSAVDAGASAVAAGAFFVFQGTHRAVLITYPQYQELEKLLSSTNE